MLKRLLPDYYVPSIFSIDYEKLKGKNINNIIFDIDNTLMPWGSSEPDENVKKLIYSILELGFNICLLSNSSAKRVKKFKGTIKIETYSAFGIKPMKRMFIGAIKRINSNRLNTCIIGDQIFTDIFGANRCGIITILVDPIDKREFITTRLIRKLERKIKFDLQYSKEIMRNE